MKPCLVCQHNSAGLFCSKQQQTYLQCSKCGHVFVTEPTAVDALKASYENRESHHGENEKIRWDYSHIKHELVYKPLLDRISLFTRKGKLLDIGCSNGSFVHSAQKMGWQAFGMELEKKSIEIARSFGLTVFTKDLMTQALPAGSFQVVTMWQVLEHLADPIMILNEIRRILKPGGVLALSTPNISSIGWMLLKGQWGAIEPDVHLNLFNSKGVRKIAESCGFRMRFVESVDVKPATVKAYLKSILKHHDRGEHDRVAAFTKDKSDIQMRRLFAVRRLLNIPLRIFDFGEDIYAYLQK